MDPRVKPEDDTMKEFRNVPEEVVKLGAMRRPHGNLTFMFTGEGTNSVPSRARP